MQGKTGMAVSAMKRELSSAEIDEIYNNGKGIEYKDSLLSLCELIDGKWVDLCQEELDDQKQRPAQQS